MNIYIIPHTHLDAGWIKTTDQTYEEHAKRIIESVLEALDYDYRYRFNWADTYFFARWYEETTPYYRELAERMIKQK